MAASSAARLSDIGFSLVTGSPGVFRRTRRYIPAAGPELIATGSTFRGAGESRYWRGADVPETDAGAADFAEFVDESLPALLRFGYVLTGSAQEAEDLVQDALAKSLRRWGRVQADNPVAYTRRVMINTHLTRWRRWGARVRLGDVPEAATDDAGLRRGEDWDALRRALAT